jgi:glutathione S-transferase
MKLYFSPLACSLATRIALYEAGALASFVQVDGKTKRTRDGRDFFTINPLGLVPTLETDAGDVLAESAAVLQYVARSHPAAQLAPEDTLGRSRLQQWLGFIGTELHKSVYVPLLDPNAHDAVKAYALSKVELRFGWLAQKLEGRAFLLDSFTIADAYLFAVLNWSTVVPVPLERWPAVHAYHQLLGRRPSVARAFAEELELYREELVARSTK